MSDGPALPIPPKPRGGPPATSLESLFAPQSVAVIGATDKPGSVGRAVLENLSAFAGQIFPINPNHQTLLGRPTYPHLAAVPAQIDLAVIVTPAPTVPALIRGCVAAGVPGAVIISAGFKEIGPAGAALEQEILTEARRGSLRILGPNCLGVMSPHRKFNATFATDLARPGHVAFISQSGALCTAILDWSFRENVGFSAFVSVGSMLDVGWGDLIDHFGNDPHTRSIVCYMESIGDARHFLSAAREVALTKPIILLKVGRTGAAAKAAASHTGALTGSDDVLDAAFRRVGVLRVETIGELFNLAEVLAKQPRPRGPRLAILTNAGGPGALSTDMLLQSGAQLAPLSPDTEAALNDGLPAHWSHGNPVDILGDADAERYARATELLARDPLNDGLLVILTPQKMTDATAIAQRLRAWSHLEGKPVLASWMGDRQVAAGESILNDAGVPTYRDPDQAARTFALMWRYADTLRALYETPGFETPAANAAHTPSARGLLQRIRESGRTLLTEPESKQLLAAYGIPTVETQVARTKDEAVAHAIKLGFPVVLKLFSETLTHKTDVGGVQLDLRDADAVRKAWHAIETTVRKRAGSGHFLGCTVQPMIAPGGYELILGSSLDAQFGPVLLFGTGGQLVEVFHDRALALPPLNATLARRLMEQTKIFGALQGIRGRAPVNLAALEQLLVRFSQLVVEQRWIAEIDINPLLASPEGLLALDARVVLHPANVGIEQVPRLAIRPYPTQYCTQWQLNDGTPIHIRPIRPEDEPRLVQFHTRLDASTVQHYDHLPRSLTQRIAHERLARLCFIDYDREMALVAERRDPVSGAAEILGVGRLRRRHGSPDADFTLVLIDAWQQSGLGIELLKLLIRIGREEQIGRITGHLRADNSAQLFAARELGFTLIPQPGAPEIRAEWTPS